MAPIELCEYAMSIPLHSTLDDWSRNVIMLSTHISTELLLEVRGTYIRMHRSSVRDVVIIFADGEIVV